ncbi:PPOX class F420-dependent oxidoreductase [Nocardia vinacea]|uniref:PPOX class F420-dependent oxidoreductase n=1 Tax=Nocardia vinacea TaxID=96468 RepID=UPI0002E6D3C5|nr:PPOX class F420-dependent oxidoreductase [Nocardia vinacea]
MNFAEVVTAENILLTTFTKDGRPKPTPVWAAYDGDRLLIVTDEASWKAKRIRNTARVTVAACDLRGNPKSDAVEAVATILDKSDAVRIARAVNARQGLMGLMFTMYSRLRGVADKYVPIEIKASVPAQQ